MSERMENIGQRESLRHIRKRLEAEAVSHRDSLRAALPLVGDVAAIDGEYVLSLAVALNEKTTELHGVNQKLAILDRELGN